MVQSRMSEHQTARRQQSAQEASCTTSSDPLNKASEGGTKIFLYFSLQHSLSLSLSLFFSLADFSLFTFCLATSPLPLLRWPAERHAEDCGSVSRLGQRGEFPLLLFLLPCISSHHSSQPPIPSPFPSRMQVGFYSLRHTNEFLSIK